MVSACLENMSAHLTKKDFFLGLCGGVAVSFIGAAFGCPKNLAITSATIAAIAIPTIRSYQKMKEDSCHFCDWQGNPLRQEFPKGFYDIKPIVFHLTSAQEKAREFLSHYKQILSEDIASQIDPNNSASLLEQEKWLKEEILRALENAPTPEFENFEEETDVEQNRSSTF